MFMAKNTMSRINGFTPEQVARRLPASIVSGSEAASHELAESESAEGDQFRKALQLRSSARRAFVEADNCSSFRRALLRRGRPLRDQYEVGDWVLHWKRKGGNMRRERGRWYGPARVAMVEGLRVPCEQINPSKPGTAETRFVQGMEGSVNDRRGSW